MGSKATQSRRRFFRQAGAALSAPLVVASAAPAEGARPDRLDARVVELEAINAIRELNETFARHINARDHDALAMLFANPRQARVDRRIVGLDTDPARRPHDIELAPDGATATSRVHCIVELEVEIADVCTLVEMARLQGEGVVRHSVPRVLANTCVKRDGVWKIATAELESA